MESPFAITAAIISERANAFDDLRIIARDCKSLSVADRALIESAADELETSQRGHLATYTQLLETQQRLIAANEQLIEMRRKQPPAMKWSLSSGWIKVKTA